MSTAGSLLLLVGILVLVAGLIIVAAALAQKPGSEWRRQWKRDSQEIREMRGRKLLGEPVQPRKVPFDEMWTQTARPRRVVEPSRPPTYIPPVPMEIGRRSILAAAVEKEEVVEELPTVVAAIEEVPPPPPPPAPGRIGAAWLAFVAWVGPIWARSIAWASDTWSAFAIWAKATWSAFANWVKVTWVGFLAWLGPAWSAFILKAKSSFDRSSSDQDAEDDEASLVDPELASWLEELTSGVSPTPQAQWYTHLPLLKTFEEQKGPSNGQ